MFEWMAWTLPVAVFFTCIVLMLVGHDGVGAQVADRACARASCRSRPRAATVCSSACSSAAYLNLAFVAVSEKMVGWFSLAQEPSIWYQLCRLDALTGIGIARGLTAGTISNGSRATFPTGMPRQLTGSF